MRFVVAALVLVCFAVPGLPQKKKSDVEVLETKGKRDEGKIQLDIRVKTSGEKVLRGLIVVFDLMSPEKNVVGSLRATLDDSPVEPGQERDTTAETAEHVRAVQYKIRAFDGSERELRVANDGPFPIE